MAEDATKVAPHVYKVLFENERARVLDVSIGPGERTEMHSHPAYAFHLLAGGKVRFTDSSGQSEEADLPEGVTMWREAEEHSTENIGDTTVHAIFFEPK